MTRNDRPRPIPEELLDQMIGVLEGRVNRLAERALSSNIVLAPLSLSMNLTLRFWRRVLKGARQ